MRRLLVYILIDTSASMRGEPIEAVKAGLQSLLYSLRQDPDALERVCLSIISYHSHAEQVLPLTEVYKVILPEIETKGGSSALGEALVLLSSKYDEDVIRTTVEQKGDLMPLVFLMADSESSGPLVKPITEVKKRPFSLVVACDVGGKAHIDVFMKITNDEVLVSSNKAEYIKSYFKWMSNILSTPCLNRLYNNEIYLDELSPVPQGIMVLCKNNNQ